MFIYELIGVQFLWAILITISILIFIPDGINREILYCTKCKSGKFLFIILDEDKDLICKNCNIPMERMEIPKNLYKRRIENFQIMVSLWYPLIIIIYLSYIF